MTEPAQRARPFVLAALAVLVALAGVVLAAIALDDDDSDVRSEGASTTTSSSSSTSTTSAPTTTTTTTAAPSPPAIDSTTPLDPRGVGPIEAGMTVAEAAEASGLSLTPDGFEDFGGHCYYVDLEGQPDLAIRVHSPGDQPVTDPNDGVISAITIYDQDPAGPSARTTVAGIGLGATEAEVRAAHPDVDEQPHQYVPEGAYLYVHPPDAPGFGIRYVLDESRTVTSIDVGDEGGIQAVEGCA